MRGSMVNHTEDLDKRFEMPKALKVAQAVFKVLSREPVWDALR